MPRRPARACRFCGTEPASEDGRCRWESCEAQLAAEQSAVRAVRGDAQLDAGGTNPATHAPSGSAGNPYPTAVASVLDDSMTFPPEVEAAVKQFRALHVWRGTPGERIQKLRQLYGWLAAAVRIDPPELVCRPGATDCYFPTMHRIQLNRDVLSVVTALHEFGHAMGFNEEQTCRWSINLFRKFFPKSYARLTPVGHTLRRSR